MKTYLDYVRAFQSSKDYQQRYYLKNAAYGSFSTQYCAIDFPMMDDRRMSYQQLVDGYVANEGHRRRHWYRCTARKRYPHEYDEKHFS